MEKYEHNYHLLRVLGHKLYHYGNKGGQKRILIALHKNNGQMSQKALMEHLNVKAGSLSEILSKMEEDGLIIRKPNSERKKCLDILVTDLGNEKIHEYIDQRNQLIQQLFNNFTDEEICELEKLLNKCIKNFDSMEG